MMEKMQVDSNDIIFVLDEERFPVDKKRLIQKSIYFSALFSGKYKDSDTTEFPIQLKWSCKNVLAFSCWINENNEYDESYYSDFKKRFKKDVIFDIMELIDIANYFVVDQLVKDLKKIIIEYHLVPSNVLHLWLHVRNQPMLHDLRDLCFSLCVQRFDQLPRFAVLELPYEDFIELIANVNLNIERKILIEIITEWNIKNNYTLEHKLKEIIRRLHHDVDYQDVMQCSVKYRYGIFHDLLLYIWDGQSVSEMIIDLPFKNKQKLIGTRIIFQGFDMYLIGGQFDYKEFNHDIWKYSFITKKWYYVTRMPQVLRHMTVIFWKTRLYLIGGTGRFRLKIDTQMYYDIEADSWSQHEPTKGFFTDQSLACIVENKIFVLRSLPYLHCPEMNSWAQYGKTGSKEFDFPRTQVKSVTSYKNKIIFTTFIEEEYQLTTMTFHNGNLTTLDLSIPISSVVCCKNEVIGLHETDNQIVISTLYFSKEEKEDILHSRYYYIHNIRNTPCSWDDVDMGFFNLLNPDSLYKKRPDLLEII